MDIGGGSTELVISDGSRVLLTESLPLGVVRLVDRFGRNDPPSDKDRKAMKKAIRRVARRAADAVRKKGFKTCVGLLRHDPVPVARPRGRGGRPGAQPHRPPDADPRRA